LFLTSAITGESMGELLTLGITPAGKERLHAKHSTATVPASSASGAAASAGTGSLNVAGLASPFPAGVKVAWGRNDQGVDGVLPPGTPMRAIADGVISIAHNPDGFGSNYAVLHTTAGPSYYYGHSIPLANDGAKVKAGQIIAKANEHGQGNATTPGAFEIGEWPPGSMKAGEKIRAWLEKLKRY
jgi:murein DD-endopeptidase MepM/ murein hydrolase activator NlpD